ncbi:MAG: 4-hydroxy-3-methylbut-2-enyl diphosphate reductase [Candidatus Omnitrophica bacterium]|nr:4-hydroxy-3-methylbut-2-enyl diphosphate reductase [Candidatus Omnitrophota bacterium]
MKVEVAGCSGFCFGVKRALRIVEEALKKNKGKQVYSFGPIIHNNQVVEELSRRGLRTIRKLDGINEGVVVISSHGASPKIFEQVKTKGLTLIDATCPYVMSAQKIVKSLIEEGYSVLIFGDSNHPEVESLVGFADGKAIVVGQESELWKTPALSRRVGIVSQTTQSLKNYFEIISKMLKKGFMEVRIFNTICTDTQKRQESAAQLAKLVDVMIIVGGKISANTKRLFDICSKICKNTYLVETVQELQSEWFKDKTKVGVASGASTPDWIIEGIKNEILLTRGIYAK